MRFHVTMICDNAAFEDRALDEVARILGQLAERLKLSDDTDGKLRDVNGNVVGNWALDGEG